MKRQFTSIEYLNLRPLLHFQGIEASNVSGSGGNPVKGSQYAADRHRSRRKKKLKINRMAKKLKQEKLKISVENRKLKKSKKKSQNPN